ncbi:MAG: GNAT family N-acetyltransferase [Alistipes sp.]|nr:GNAT family N-acetyltransferase [Alistipes sp.]
MTNIKIERITSADGSTAEAISLLLKQLSSQEFSFSERELAALVTDPSSSLFLLYAEDKIAGMLTLGTYLSPTGRKAWIEDVVVDSAYRGKGYGKMLVEHAIEYARTLSPCTLMLTSNPARIAANELYRASGFEQKITNVYKMSL